MRSVTEQLYASMAEQRATAKLKLAYATRNPHGTARSTGVRLVSPGHDQVQEIFDDGSVRNPYKVNRALSGRQRKKMRKQTNRVMKSRGIPGRLEDVLKGRRVGTLDRPQPGAPESPAPTVSQEVAAGMPVAPPSGD